MLWLEGKFSCFRRKIGFTHEKREDYRGVSGFYDPEILHLFSLHRDDVGVSRRRKEKERLRRDARVCYRGVTSGLTSENHEVSRSALCSF